MKIKLTESELINLIKRVINEQIPNLGGVSAIEMGTSASDWGLQIGQSPDYTESCQEEFKNYEMVANSFNWCRYDSKSDKYAWADNWAANQVKKDVETTSTEDLITPALKTISTAKDFCQFVNSYYKFKGDLYNDIDKYVTMYNKWDRILESIPKDFKDKSGLRKCKKAKTWDNGLIYYFYLMKYLITESQLDKAIFKYLDNQDFVTINYTYETYFANSTSDRQAVILHDYRDERCYVSIELIDEISIFFSLDETLSKKIIGDWVGDKLNTKVKYVSFVGDFFSHYLTIR